MSEEHTPEEVGTKGDRLVVTENRLQGEAQRIQGEESSEPTTHVPGTHMPRDKRIHREHDVIKGDVSRNIMAEKAHLGKRGVPEKQHTPTEKNEEHLIRSPVLGELPETTKDKDKGSVIEGPHRELGERIVEVQREEQTE